MTWLRNPWGRPRFLALITGALHPLVDHPVADRDRCSPSTTAARGRPGRASRSAGSRARPAASCTIRRCSDALEHTLLLAVICVAVAVPLGVALALGLQRWRGRGARHGQHADAAAARDARDRDGRRAAPALPADLPRHRARHRRRRRSGR